MATVVLVFPTPSDMKAAIFGEEEPAPGIVNGGIDRQASYGSLDGTMPELIASLDQCLATLSIADHAAPPSCRDTMIASADRIRQAPTTPETTILIEKLRLGTALFCRKLWVEARQENKAFDIASCEAHASTLAEKA